MARRKPPQPARQLVLLTGLSGSGKGSVLKTFEDLGFYCVDNLPVGLISQFSELYAENEEAQRAALLVDAREGAQLRRLPAIYRRLRRKHPATLVFVEASEDALLRRFSETRRPHPMGRGDSVREGIRRGVLRLPLGEAKISGVDVRDVAEVAAVALTEAGHRNKIYSLGEHLLSPREQVALLSKVLGREIVYEPISDHEAAQALRAAGVDRQAAKWWRVVYQLMRQGAYSATVPDVSRVLGRPSIPFKQFAQDYAHVWQPE